MALATPIPFRSSSIMQDNTTNISTCDWWSKNKKLGLMFTTLEEGNIKSSLVQDCAG
uniref:Uncharacterized protein n=1 Tax=Triticum urartu TaxID=4572 RepID=A0A8R7Q353_TRIUA